MLSNQSDGNADGDAHGNQQDDLAHDEPTHMGAFGTQSHADANLVGAPRDDIRHEAVDSDAGEKDGQDPKEGGELCDQSLVGDGTGYLLVQRRDASDWQVVIHAVNCILNRGGDSTEVSGVANLKVVEILLPLGVGDVIKRLGSFVKAFKLYVLDNADYFDVAGVLRASLP